MRAKYLPDEPVAALVDDVLGLDGFARGICAAIADASAPYVFGVYGDWGVGKTSSMKLLALQLEQALQDGTGFDVPVWLNIWRFENQLNMLYPILHALKEDFHTRLPGVPDESLRRKMTRLVGSSLVAFADLGLRTVTKQLTGEALKLSDVKDHMTLVDSAAVDELDRLLAAWAAEVTRLPALFEDFTRAYAEQLAAKHGVAPERLRFVFLIDDLDRCLPDSVIAVLERIKNFLSVPGCLYVLGINQFVVHQGVRAKFSTVQVDGAEYLEKIVNHSFHVPAPGAGAIRDFAANRLGRLLPPDEKPRYEPRLLAFGRVLEACRFTNPRKIKRILNRYLAFVDRHGLVEEPWRDENIVRLIVMAEYFPDIFRVFTADPVSAKEALLALADGASDFAAFEQRFGVSLGVGRERIAAMRSLFDLQPADSPRSKDIADHVVAVAAFTRAR